MRPTHACELFLPQACPPGVVEPILPGLQGAQPHPGRRFQGNYHFIFTQCDETIPGGATVDAAYVTSYDPLWDLEVLRNVTVQRMAEGLRAIDRLYQARRYEEAWDLAYRLEQALREVARLTGEAQMVKDADLMRTYEDTLARWVQQETGCQPRPAEPVLPERPLRGRDSTPVPDAPTIEIR